MQTIGEMGGSQSTPDPPVAAPSTPTPTPKPTTQRPTAPHKGRHLLPPRIEEAFACIKAWHSIGDNTIDANYNLAYKGGFHTMD